MAQGGNPPMRPDQALQGLSRSGTGPAPQNPFVLARVVVIFGTGETGLFQYQGAPSSGNGPILWAVPPGVTTDPFGNPLPASGGIVSEAHGGGLTAQLFAGEVIFGDTLSAYPLTYSGLLRIIHAAAVGSTAVVALDSPAGDVNQSHASLWMIGAPPAGGSFVQAAFFGAGAGGAIPVHLVVCGLFAFGVLSAGIPAANLPTLGPNTIAGNDGMLLATTATGVSVSTALLEVQGTIATSGTVEAIVSGAVETWHNAVLNNPPFAAFGAGFATPGYQFEPVNGGRVRLRGLVALNAASPASNTIFTLPVGYRPASAQSFTTAAALNGLTIANTTTIQVTTAGLVVCVPSGVNTNAVGLDGVVVELD